jgi:hypothetical protein
MTDHFSHLSKDVPLALLPVRLEARYRNRRLGLRVLPDLVHGDTHDDALTALEISAGLRYWKEYLAVEANPDEEARLKQWLADQVGPYRALWVAKKTEPQGSGDAAVFPELDPIETRSPMRARLLPDFWVLRIYDSQMNLRHTTRTQFDIADDLCMAPSLASLHDKIGEDGETDHVLAFLQRQNLDWMVDFGKAISVGMAFDIDQGDLPDHIGAALVCGVRHEDRDKDAADALNAHLQHHWYSRGVDILPQGTPTNNSDAGRTSFSVKAPDVAALFAQEGQTRPIGALGRAAVLKADPAIFYNLPAADIAALALGQNFHCLLDRVGHAEMLEGLGAWAMNTGIGHGMAEFYSRQILAHSDGTIRHEDIWPGIKTHFTRWVRGNAYIPPLRIGEQPYGILPVTAPPPVYYGWSDDFDVKFDHYLNQLIGMWMGRMSAPVLDPNATDGAPGNTQRMAVEAIADVLGAVPHPTNFQLRELTLHLEEDAQAFDEIMNELDALANRDDVPISSDPWVFFSNDYWEPRRASFSGVPTSEDPNVYVYDIAAQRLQLDLMVSEIETHAPSHNRDDMLEIIETRLRPLIDMYYEAYVALPHVWAELCDSGGLSGASPPAVRHEPIPRLVASTFSDIVEAVGDIIGDAESLVNLRDLLLEMADTLGKGTAIANRVPVITGENPLLHHLLHESYLRVPAGSSAAVSAAFSLIAARITKVLDSGDNLESLKHELSRMLRETLGLLMHRLDAWVTSRAARDLAELRVKKPRGLTLGGYGWLLDLRKSRGPLSDGFIHAPSMNSATAAAVLRSGWSAYGTSSSTKPLSVDLSSDRARNGQWILDGIRNGQDLSELLGARFERYLHDAQLDFAIDDIRAAVSKALTGTPNANAVVDGLSLARAFSDDPLPSEIDVRKAVEAVVSAAPAARQQGIKDMVKKVTRDLDSCADLTMAQTVFSLVRGDVDGAGAALSITGGEDGVVPETSVLDTPREAQLITHRMTALFGIKDADASAPSVLAGAEPRLSHWASRQLPDASRIQFRVLALNADGTQISNRMASIEAIGLTALEAAMLTSRQADQSGGRLARLIRACLMAQSGGKAAGLVLDFDAASAGGISLNTFGLLSAAMKDMLAQTRPLRSTDLELPQPETATAQPFDTVELDTRISKVTTLLKGLSDTLATARTEDDICALAAKAMALNISGALPLAETPSSKTLRAKLQEHLDARIADLSDTASVADPAERLANAIARTLPVIPLFALAADPARKASAIHKGRADTLKTSFDMWWRKVCRVQSSTGLIAEFQDLQEALGLSPYTQPEMCQLPANDDDWAGVTKPAADNRDRLCLYTFAGADHLGTGRLIGGLVFASWTEGIPRADHQTGIAYHYDTPSARAPQCILLSIPGTGDNREDDIFAQLLHTLDLMKIRAVAPDRLKVSPREGHPYYDPRHPEFVEPSIGQFLPATFLPEEAKITRKET